MALPGDPIGSDEDCLTLNVWTPATDDRRRPVMVWIHGGGFTTGSGSFHLYRGTELATNGDVVVVTLNYRLGALGFLAHPELADDATPDWRGNWGLMDQVAALRWVRDNIAGFGGDPANVTIFGESAGAMSVVALLGAPAARGLFHRAAIQSGPPHTHSPERATQTGEDLIKELAIGEPTRALLESVPAPELVAASQLLQGRPPPPGELPLPFLPVVGGEFLPREPLDAVARGELAGIPLLVGTTRDELTLFALGDPRVSSIDDAGVVRWMSRTSVGLDAARAVETYRSARAARGESTSPRDMWVAMGTDLVFRWPTIQLASAQGRHQPDVFVYLFTWETPFFGGQLGACHALEIPFVFGNVHRPQIAAFIGGGPEAEALAGSMQAAWLAFARRGDPSHRGMGTWDRWDAERRPTMMFGPTVSLVERPRDEELAVWSELQPLS